MKKKYIFTFALIAFINAEILSSQEQFLFQSQPRWNKKLNFSDIESRLKSEQIIAIKHVSVKKEFKGNELKKINDFNSLCIPNLEDKKIYLVLLESGLQAIFKVRETCYCEAAAYEGSKFLDLRLVPPAIIRNINGDIGSLQFYVEPDILEVREKSKILKKIDSKIKSDIAIFHFIFGQTDAFIQNKIIQMNESNINLALIDYERINRLQKANYRERPFIYLGNKQNLPADYFINSTFDCKETRLLTLENFQESMPILEKVLTLEEIKEVYSWLKTSEKNLSYVIWQNSFWYDLEGSFINFTKKFYNSTLEFLKKLDINTLRLFWGEYLEQCSQTDKEHLEKIFFETLNRRDAILKASTKYKIYKNF